MTFPPQAPAFKLRLLVRYSAASKDVALAEELLGHLRPLERFAGLDVWTDARIRAGDDTRKEIQRAIDQADVALLLLSSDFLASDGLVEREVPRLLERHRTGKLRVIPIVLRSCLWELHPWLAELDPLPKDREPIASRQGDARDRALTELAKEIVGLIAPASGSPTAKANEQPPPTNEPTPKPGGDIYNIHIHGSTIGALGAGQGVKVTGSLNAELDLPAGSPHSTTKSPERPDSMDQLRKIAAASGVPSVYLSYDAADDRFARRIYTTFGPYKLLCYIAEHALGGELIGQVALVSINQHDRIVVMCSQRSLSNPRVLSDLEETLAREAREGGMSRLILLDLDGFVRSPEWQHPNTDLAHAAQGRLTIGMIGADRDAGTLAMGMAKLIRALNGVAEP